MRPATFSPALKPSQALSHIPAARFSNCVASMAESGNPLIFVTRKWPPAMGGIETYCLKLVEELRTRRRVELVALPGAPDGSVPRARQLLAFGFATCARILFGRALPDLIHVSDMASWP